MKVTLPIKNFPAQQSIFESKKRFKIAVKGRRFGLTKGAANDFIVSALKKQFKQGLWVDTVNVNIDRYIERYFIPYLNKLPAHMWSWKKQAKIIQIHDSYIDFRSAESPENIEGFGYDKFFLNEAGIILNDSYLWNNAIKPMLWEFPNTSGVIGGTPKGKNVFYELAMRGMDPEQPDYEYFHFTSFDNPFIDTSLIKQDIASMPERVVQQEIYAQFLDDTGVVFRNVKNVATATPQKPIVGHLYVMGVDLAKVQDWTVITVYDRKNNKQVYQDRFKELEWPFQKKKIASVSRHYNNALVVLDATGLGDPVADDLLRSGVSVEPFKLSNPSKKEIIENLSIYIEQGNISILNIAETIAEFNAFTYDVSNSGRVTYGAPVGFHDDIVIAHALAVNALHPLVAKDEPETVSLIRQEYLRRIQKGDSYEFVFDRDAEEL